MAVFAPSVPAASCASVVDGGHPNEVVQVTCSTPARTHLVLAAVLLCSLALLVPAGAVSLGTVLVGVLRKKRR